MKPTEDWTCPICGEPCLPDDHCKHVYFDSQVFVGPLLKSKYLYKPGKMRDGED